MEERELMGWNYRIIRTEDPPLPDGTSMPVYAIHEVYYYEDGSPKMLTEGACGPMGSTVEELSGDLAWMVKALTRPVLSLDLKEVEPAHLLADDLLAAIEKDPQSFPDLLRKSDGSA